MTWKRLWRLVLVATTSLLLLEAVLQVGAVYTWLRYRPAAVVDPSAVHRSVLCIGDSFTFGVGASAQEMSYPGQLEGILRERSGDRSWRVVNAGKAGNSSSDVLARLDGQLASAKPEVVCLLVGLNDFWSRPDRLVLSSAPSESGAAGESFELRWRTGILLKLIRAMWSPEIRRATEGTGARAEAKGTEAKAPETKGPEAKGTEARAPESRQDAPAAPAAGPSAASAPPADASPQVKIDRTEPRPDTRGWSAISKGAFAEALEWFKLDLSRHPNSWSHVGLVHCYLQLGRRDEAAPELDWLRQNCSREPSRANYTTLLVALDTVGADEERLALARRVVVEDPGCHEAWFQVAWGTFQAGDMKTARPALERALDLAKEADPGTQKRYLFFASRVLHDVDDAGSLACLIRIALVDPSDTQSLVREVRLHPEAYPRQMLDRALDQLALTGEQRSRIVALHAEATQASDRKPVIETLEFHMLQTIERCRKRGARLLLVTYPFANDELKQTFQAVAARVNVPVVDVLPAMTKALESRVRSELFVPDGHCSNVGYRIMAEEVASQVLAQSAR